MEYMRTRSHKRADRSAADRWAADLGMLLTFFTQPKNEKITTVLAIHRLQEQGPAAPGAATSALPLLRIRRAVVPAPVGRGKNRSLDEHIPPEQVRHIRSAKVASPNSSTTFLEEKLISAPSLSFGILKPRPQPQSATPPLNERAR